MLREERQVCGEAAGRGGSRRGEGVPLAWATKVWALRCDGEAGRLTGGEGGWRHEETTLPFVPWVGHRGQRDVGAGAAMAGGNAAAAD